MKGKEKGTLGDLPEELPIPEGISDEVKKKLLEFGVPEKPEIEVPEITNLQISPGNM